MSDEELREMVQPYWKDNESLMMLLRSIRDRVREETEKRVRRETLEWVLNNACNYQAANMVSDHIALELRRAAEEATKP